MALRIPKKLGACAALLGLAACVALKDAENTDPQPIDLSAACDLQSAQVLIGKSRAEIAEIPLPKWHRIIAPDSAITMDFIAERLNIQMDATDHAARVFCG